MNRSVCRRALTAMRCASPAGPAPSIKSKVFALALLLGCWLIPATFVLSQTARPDQLSSAKTPSAIESGETEREIENAAAAGEDEAEIPAVNYYARANAFGGGNDRSNNDAASKPGRQTAVEKIYSGLTKPGLTIKDVDRRSCFDGDVLWRTRIDRFNSKAVDSECAKNFLSPSISRAGRSFSEPASGNERPARSSDDAGEDNSIAENERGFDWGSAVEQSLLFLAIQHGYAFTQPKTRRALKGSFFGDYFESVKSLRGWGDGGRFFTNYIAHPMQGAFTGYIQIQNDSEGKRQRFGASSDYWKSRLKALGWSALWSTQFEIGPISQASIGNVGLSGKQTWVDIVVTPTVGTAMLIAEDALDRYVVERIERGTGNYYLMIFSRMLLNPTRTMANLIRFKLPWYRDRGRMRQ